MSTSVLLKNVRIAFPQVFQPKAVEDGGRKRYSLIALIDPNEQADQVKAVEEAIDTEIKEKWGNKAEQVKKQLQSEPTRLALRDGDLKADQYPGFEGMLFVSAARQENQGPPKVIDRKKADIREEDGLIYGGIYANVKFDIYAQEAQGIGKRVNAGLQAMQWVAEGEPFGGGGTPGTEEFEELEPAPEAEDSLLE